MDRIRRLIVLHRRPLAALCATLAVLAALQSLQPDDTTVEVTVAARDLPSGHVVTASDLTTARLSPDAVPDQALDDAVGRRVAGPMRRGEPITDRRVLAPRDSVGDATLTMVRLADPAAVVGLRVGDVVDVVAASDDDTAGAVVLAPRAVVAVLPDGSDVDSAPTIGVTTDHDTAVALATRAIDATLSLVVTP